MDLGSVANRRRLAWWALVAVLAWVLVSALQATLGIVALGLFVYYGVRPLHHRLRGLLGSANLAASATLLLIAVPVVVAMGYVVVAGVYEILGAVSGLRDVVGPWLPQADPRTLVREFARNPDTDTLQRVLSRSSTLVGLLSTVLLHLFVAVAFAYFLLKDGARLRRWVRAEVGPDTAWYAYLDAVDRDLESVYSGYVMLIAAVAVAAAVVYHGFNAAPFPLTIPFPTFLALLTGVTSLVPIIVSKVVYVPIAGFLALRASVVDASMLVPLGFLAVCFLVLDILPQTFLMPLLAGRGIHVGLVMLSLAFGTTLFGWYGLFLSPAVVVLVVQLVRIVLPELVRNEELTPSVSTAESLGADPDVATGSDPDDDETDG